MNRTIFLSLLSALCFTACSSDDEETANVEKPIPVVVNITEEPMVDEAAGARTRTVPITTSTLNKFYMEFNDGSSWNQSEWNKNGSWSSGLTWPNESSYYPLTFYAYRDKETESGTRVNYTEDASKLPYITITTDEYITSTRDVLVATSGSFSYENRGSSVDLTFKHICSAVHFTISKTNALSGYEVKVNNVVLHNVVTTADYFFNSDSWTLSDTKSNYTLTTSEKTLSTDATSLTAENEYWFLLPQTLTPWDKTATLANTYLELDCSIYNSTTQQYIIGGASSYGKAYLSVGGTLEKGKYHTINLKVGTGLRNSSGTKIIQ